MPHPLGRDLTRAAEAAGALRALVLADDPAVRCELLHFAHRLRRLSVADPRLRATVGRLASALEHGDHTENVLEA